jgi:hypothetical protein
VRRVSVIAAASTDPTALAQVRKVVDDALLQAAPLPNRLRTNERPNERMTENENENETDVMKA